MLCASCSGALHSAVSQPCANASQMPVAHPRHHGALDHLPRAHLLAAIPLKPAARISEFRGHATHQGPHLAFAEILQAAEFLVLPSP